MLTRLKQSSGNVMELATAGSSAESQQDDSKLVRRAILVHSGPEGEALTFLSMDGKTRPFDKARIQNIVKVHNEALDALAAEYAGEEKIPMGAYQPILDMHDDESSNDCVIGRLTGRLTAVQMDVPKVGKNVWCAVADPGITFLGKPTVDRVKDGRIYHLSIGIDEETDKLGETSTVIDPAAPGAMLLSKSTKTGNKTSKGDSKMPTLNLKKRLAAHEARKTRLASMQATLTQLTAATKSTGEVVRLTQKKGEVTHRLSALMKSGKLTPAEYKKLDLTRLSALDENALSVVLESYDAREPVIQPGQRGTTDAVDFATIGASMKKTEVKRLKAEIKGDFKRLTGKKMGAEDEEGDEKDMGAAKDPHAVAGQGGDEKQMSHMAEMKKHLEAGDIAKAKECYAKMAAGEAAGEGKEKKEMAAGGNVEADPIASDVKSEDYKKSMESLQGQVDELNTQLARMAGMVSELMKSEEEEGHDLAAAGTEEKVDEKQMAGAEGADAEAKDKASDPDKK